MLSPKEKAGLTEILEKLDKHGLISLAGTVTKNMIKPETRKEAISIILMYSENAFTLLNRRKIKKEILFHYLKDNGIPSPFASEKAKFVMACLKMWESDIDYDSICEMEDVEESDETSSPTSEAPSYNNNLLVTPISLYQSTTNITLQQVPLESDLERMGREFVSWFYGLLNNINVGLENFTPNHFWPDCMMHLQINATNTQLQALGIGNTGQALNSIHSEQILGAQRVSDALIKFVTMGRLFFHPNSTHYGVSCFVERHGLVKVLASGVLHKDNRCIGLFDQSFGLVRSAGIENNWKIKYMELLLKMNIHI